MSYIKNITFARINVNEQNVEFIEKKYEIVTLITNIYFEYLFFLITLRLAGFPLLLLFLLWLAPTKHIPSQ